MSSGRETTVIARTVTRTVVPLILVTAVALLLQGHNLPGGGFVGGVLTTTGFALVYVIYGIDYLERDLLGTAVEQGEVPSGLTRVYAFTFAVGLALAAGSGVVAMALGSIFVPQGLPFLSQAVFFLEDVPLYGTFEIASALAFDVGVYLVVVGGLLTIVSVVGAE